jgi:hypothetical protein
MNSEEHDQTCPERRIIKQWTYVTGWITGKGRGSLSSEPKPGSYRIVYLCKRRPCPHKVTFDEIRREKAP